MDRIERAQLFGVTQIVLEGMNLEVTALSGKNSLQQLLKANK
jgi:hypothetical protein